MRLNFNRVDWQDDGAACILGAAQDGCRSLLGIGPGSALAVRACMAGLLQSCGRVQEGLLSHVLVVAWRRSPNM